MTDELSTFRISLFTGQGENSFGYTTLSEDRLDLTEGSWSNTQKQGAQTAPSNPYDNSK